MDFLVGLAIAIVHWHGCYSSSVNVLYLYMQYLKCVCDIRKKKKKILVASKFK